MAERIVELVPMSSDEFKEFVAAHEEDYAQERSRNLETEIQDERRVAKRQYDEIAKGFEAGRVRAEFMLVHGDRVGVLLYSYDKDKKLAYLHYISVSEAYRRKGYAGQALELLEQVAIGLGAEKIALNVFGDNGSAKRLYEKNGYRSSFHGMHKKLRSG